MIKKKRMKDDSAFALSIAFSLNVSSHTISHAIFHVLVIIMFVTSLRSRRVAVYHRMKREGGSTYQDEEQGAWYS